MTNYQDFLSIMTKAKERLKGLAIVSRKNPAAPFVGIGLILFLTFVFSGNSKAPRPHPLMEETVLFEPEGTDMVGVKESVDPRDTWTANVQKEVSDMKDELTKQLELKAEEAASELKSVKEEMEVLKASLLNQQKSIEDQRLEASFNASNGLETMPQVILPPAKSLGFFTKDYGTKKRNIKEYIPSGTFARAVLMTGVVVGTGTDTQSNPEPIRLRLTDVGILSKNLRIDQIKEAILIGDCSGNLSSERAKCRLQKISLENNKGEVIERAVEGWVIGEDGRNGVKGIVVDKSSDLLRMAMVSGMLNGFSQFLQNQSTRSVFPISPISGQQNALSNVDMLKGGVASGAGDAFAKLANFGIERFNSMSPQIVIASGREVDVLFGNGVDLNSSLEESNGKSIDGKSPDGNLRSASNEQNANGGVTYSKEGYDSFNEALTQMNAAKAKKEEHDGF